MRLEQPTAKINHESGASHAIHSRGRKAAASWAHDNQGYTAQVRFRDRRFVFLFNPLADG